MNEITYNNYDLVAFEQNGEVVVAVTFYRYYKKKAKGEVNYRWRTRCPELVDKIVKHRTKVFKRDGIKKAFEDYIMSVPSIFRIHIADCDIRYLLRSWGVEFDEDDDEIYILYKRIIREVFFKMCEDMKVC